MSYDPNRKPGMSRNALATAAFLALLVIAMAFGVGRCAAANGATAPAERIVVTEPAHCHPVRCSQLRVITTYRHGQDTVRVTKLRSRPVESRSRFTTPPWSRWSIVAAVIIPCGCGTR